MKWFATRFVIPPRTFWPFCMFLFNNNSTLPLKEMEKYISLFSPEPFEFLPSNENQFRPTQISHCSRRWINVLLAFISLLYPFESRAKELQNKSKCLPMRWNVLPANFPLPKFHSSLTLHWPIIVCTAFVRFVSYYIFNWHFIPQHFLFQV